jgi:uncharacterized protein
MANDATSSNTANSAAIIPDDVALWPYDGTLNFDALVASGWSPSPLNEFIFKVETRCNLNCTYCYVYNLGDESWRSAPAFMDINIARVAALRIHEHAMQHGLPRVGVSLHGGEPLMRGVKPITEFVEVMRENLASVEVEFSMQTNGTLVRESIAEELLRLGIRVGVSIDGNKFANRHRVDLRGRSSFDRTVRGIQVLARHDGLVQGALAVVDIEADPIAVYRAIELLGFSSVDFLLPHGTWEARPAQKTADQSIHSPAPYARWLATIYDVWACNPDRMQVRIFDDIIHLLLGGTFSFESLGLAPAQLAVIEADGAIELVDHIGIAFAGAEATGASVLTHSFDDVLRHPGVMSRQIGEAALVEECHECPMLQICGGGLITHRWDSLHGFRNKTVYCSDMFALISHIRDDLIERAQVGVSASVS